MVLKSALREAINEVLEENGVEDGDVGDALLDRIETLVEVYDDDEEEAAEG